MAKIGTTERTNELLGGQYFDPVTGKQIKEFKPTPLPVSSAPTVANKINTIPEPRVPTVSPYYGNVGEAVASNTGYNKQLEIRLQQIADAEAEKKALAESENVKEEKSLLKSVLNSVSPQKARETAIQETGIDPKKYFAEQRAKIAEIEKLSEDYNKTEAERDRLIQQIQSNEGQGMLEAGLDSRVRDVQRKYAITLSQKSANINTKVATAQALEGNFKEAQTFVNQAVQDATNETKFRYEQYVLLKEANESAFEKLDSKYTKAFDAAMDLAKEEYETQRADKKAIGELLIDNPKAGIDIYNDTLEEALSKVGNYISVNGKSSPKKAPALFTPTQINTGSLRAGLPREEFVVLPEEVQNFFVSMSASQLTTLNNFFKEIKNGDLSSEEALAEIEGGNFTEEVKSFLIEQINAIVPKAKEPGLLSKGWDKIKSFLGFEDKPEPDGK